MESARSCNAQGPLLQRAARARDLAAEAHDARRLAFALGTCGLIERFLGRLEEARSSFESALDHARACGEPDVVVRALLNLAGFCLEKKQPKRVAALLAEARRLAPLLTDPNLRRQLEALSKWLAGSSGS